MCIYCILMWIVTGNGLVQIDDPSQRAHPGIHGPPVVVAPVVPRPQQVLAPPVVGQLIEDPAALQHMEGVQLIEPEAIVDAGTVFSELRHQGPVVVSLVQPYPVRAGLL